MRSTRATFRGFFIALAVTGTCFGLGAQIASADAISFEDDVIPVLTRFGCNSGGCHGKLAGQNGFKLSLRGFAPDADFESITREAVGRRVNRAMPELSLLVVKGLNAVPHGGGQRLAPDSPGAKLLSDWIRSGMPGPKKDEPMLVKLELTPATATLVIGEKIPLTVTAIYDDGHRRDVTWLSQFNSRDRAMIDVSDKGEVQALRHGETVVTGAFRGFVEVAALTVRYENKVEPAWYASRNNSVDEAVFDKLAQLQIEPSPLCDDATFLRRVSLDLLGVLPTSVEVRTFLADPRTDKRAQLVNALLERPEFVDYWTHWLGDLLQNRKERDHDVRGVKGVRGFHDWLRAQVAANKSWREIATSVLTAKGSCVEQPAVGYFIVTVGEMEAHESEVADSVAQAFLGTRIGCARCHNHPLEKFTQDDYYRFVGFFSRVALDRQRPEELPTTLKVGTRHQLNLLRQIEQEQKKLEKLKADNSEANKIEETEKRIADIQRQVEQAGQSRVEVRQPRTGQMLAPRPLDRTETSIASGSDPREAFVNWMTDRSNPYFSGAMVNRLWRHFLGAGLVEPVDDLRATNPPSNLALWKTLNQEFVASEYSLKHVMRLILNSRTYQLMSATRESNFRDSRFLSHFQARRLPAEVLLDAICSVTDQPESFTGYPVGLRAVQIPDPFTESYFLTLFGRSARTTACACERSGDVTLPQLLHLQNGDGLYEKIRSGDGLLSKLVAAQADDSTVVDELYLTTLSRFPTSEERAGINKAIAGVDRADRLEFFADLLWALMNSKEFTFNH